jgi:hypothetical protein
MALAGWRVSRLEARPSSRFHYVPPTEKVVVSAIGAVAAEALPQTVMPGVMTAQRKADYQVRPVSIGNLTPNKLS